VLNHLKLLIWDLDYLVFDCSALKVTALRHSLIALADSLPHSVRLPEAIDAEGGYLDYGFRWPQFLEIGLDEERLGQFQRAYQIHQDRCVQAGVGRVYPELHDFLVDCRQRDIRLALGAEASRDYLLAIMDQHRLDQMFDIALCTEEFGVGSADEMFEEIMTHTEVYPSETLVLGTRPAFFQAAHNLDLLTIGGGWGLSEQRGLAEADLQAPTVSRLEAVIEKADHLSNRYSS